MNDKPEGWYYVGDGKLRYRDEGGWTDYYLDTSDPRAMEWPPPSPAVLLQQLSEGESQPYATMPQRRGRRMSSFFYRGRHAG